ncbi:hypothetical protein CNR27_00765 [Luteimonas chenhongjianii]|uniref:Uncharacterized protein n=1 Tax=Luteimonas chenhongjianii TaxID=2006110 RepID=A0A290XAH1_9GAMM|nr:hypothetical protein [Luteimonas chenhongjianii]ATD66164.1 hypothetical protein CNR27_00765 [Luteimonas chenhongjianii]
MNKPLFFAALLCAVATAPAIAQGQSAPTLQVDSGSAMISQGGEFTPAASGTQVPAGSRVMLAEGSRATLVYPNGCSQPLSSAGVYSVPSTCVAAASGGNASRSNVYGPVGASGVEWGAVGIIGGSVAAIVAIAEGTLDDSDPPQEPLRGAPPPPVSR